MLKDYTVPEPFQRNEKMRCNICQSALIRKVGALSLYSIQGDYDTQILKCDNCGVFYRDFDYSDSKKMKDHFAMSSYTNIQKESDWRSSRSKFFSSIVRISSQYVNVNQQTRVLDFGCAYGHLLEEYLKYGVRCFGIELDDTLRQRNKSRFAGMYESSAQIPKGIDFDIITFIDSLYLVENPFEALECSNSRLRKDGIIIIRNTNRTLLLNLICRYFPAKLSNKVFGDAKYNYSHKSMEIISDTSGLKIEKVILYEKGKVLKGIKRKLKYYIPLTISLLIRVRLTPGIIYILKQK